jgi:hypothetical protein
MNQKEAKKEIKRLEKERDNAIESVKAKLDSPYTDESIRLEILELFSRVYKDETYDIKNYQQWWKDLRRLAKDE